VQIEANFEIERIIVTDLLGKQIHMSKSVSELSLPKGVFIVTVYGVDGEVEKKKVIFE
jgi:hypothetical protein